MSRPDPQVEATGGERGGAVAEPGTRPRLLFLCQSLPFPPDGGAHLRSFNILRLLAREFDVTSLSFYKRSLRPTDEDVRRGVEGLRPLGPANAYRIPQDSSNVRLLWDHLRSVVTGRVYTRYLYDDRGFSSRLDDVLATDPPDLVHVDSLDLSAYLPRMSGIPVVLTHHNVESQLLERRADAAHGLRSRYLAHQARLAVAEERRWCPRVDVNVVVSDLDGETLESIVACNTLVVRNGVDTTVFRPGTVDEPRGIVFVGGASWLPNLDAMTHFCEQILPLVRARVGDVEVTWVGVASEADRARFARYPVRLTGYVDDIQPFVHRAACYVVPLRIGGGTRLKIVDAWAMGAPMVSTSIGCEGLDAVDGKNMLIRDDPEGFADAVCQLIDQRALGDRLAIGGRRTAETTYDWDVIGEEMIGHYTSLLPERNRPT